MSALPPKADICSALADVRFVPIADIGINLVCQLFDHLVGAQQEPFRDRQAECLGGCPVDDEFEFGRLLDWKVGRL